MTWKQHLNHILRGRKITNARRSDSHGKVLILDLSDGLVIWAWSFEGELQVVVCTDNPDGEILIDLRNEACKAFTEEVRFKMVERHPHIYGPRGSDPFPPFKTYERRHHVPSKQDLERVPSENKK